MTKQVSRQIAAAFKNGKRCTKPNTFVWTGGVVLFGNTIASKWTIGYDTFGPDSEGIKLDFCGWYTRTTRDRLDAICEAYGSPIRFATRKGKPFVVNTDTYVELPFDPNKAQWLHCLEAATGGRQL